MLARGIENLLIINVYDFAMAPSEYDGENQGIKSLNRRHLLYGGAAGLAGLGGCIGDDEEPTDVDLADTEETDVAIPDDEDEVDERLDQAFVLPTINNPEDSIVFMGIWGPPLPEEFELRYDIANHVYETLYEPTMYGRYWNTAYAADPGDPLFGLLEDFEVTENEFIFTIRDDAYWSDGEPVRALDGPGHQFLQRLGVLPEPGQWMYDDPIQHDMAYTRYDDVRFPDGPDGKVFELVSHHDGMIGEWWEDPGTRTWTWLRVCDTLSFTYPTHIEPFDALTDDILTEVERGVEGEEVREPQEITGEHFDEGTFEKFRDPDNVLSTGLWQLEEMRGTEEWVLTPNEHHRRAEDLNFSEVRMPWIEEDHRLHAEMQAERVDYGQVLTPEDLVTDLEGSVYSQELAPVPDGGVIGFDHQDPVFGQVEVRQAIAYALNKAEIANTVHPDITDPVEVQGGDLFGREAFISDDWVDENLVSYSQDLDLAESLMQEAGFERDGDGNWIREGEPIQAVYPTTEDAPIEERVVVDQLNEFGFQLSLESMGGDVFDERFANGDFRIFPGGSATNWTIGFYMRGIYAQWMFAVQVADPILKGWRIYDPPEINDEIVELRDEHSFEFIARELVEPWIEIPPIGEPEADPERFYILNEVNRVFWDEGYASPDVSPLLEQLTWTDNWFLPNVQIYNLLDQHFINDTNWVWPTDHPMWDYFGEAVHPQQYLALGEIRADPDMPK